MTSTHIAPRLLGSDSNRSEEATQSKSLSNLEEDLDHLLKIGGEGATACRGTLVFNNYLNSDAKYSPTSTTPTSQSQGGLEDEGAIAS
jgi:hypothetical protein